MFRKTNIQKVIKKWRGEGLELLAPAKDSEVRQKLSGTGHRIARDVVELYCATGGMTSDEMASTLLNLWSLERIVSENFKHHRSVLLFGDFLVESYCFGLKYENENESSVYVEYFDGEQPTKVAGSLDEFFYLYLNDPLRIELMTDRGAL
jgi:exonuclease III